MYLTGQPHATSPKPMQVLLQATRHAAGQPWPQAYAGLHPGQLHLPTQHGDSLQESSLQGGSLQGSSLPNRVTPVLVSGAGPSNLQKSEMGGSSRVMQQQGADVEKGLLPKGSPGPPPVSSSASTAAPACVSQPGSITRHWRMLLDCKAT